MPEIRYSAQSRFCGRFGQFDEPRNEIVILDSQSPLHTAADVDAVRTDGRYRLHDVFTVQPSSQENGHGRFRHDPRRQRPIHGMTGSAVFVFAEPVDRQVPDANDFVSSQIKLFNRSWADNPKVQTCLLITL